MKLLASLLGALCATRMGQAQDTADAANNNSNATNTTNASAVATVSPSRLRQNFNPDRTEAWGDVELVGGGQKWEFVKGLFGGPLACEPQRLVVGDPLLGCEKLNNAADVVGNIVLLFRGECSFADKVAFAQESGAAGVIVGNTGESCVCMDLCVSGGMEEEEARLRAPHLESLDRRKG